MQLNEKDINLIIVLLIIIWGEVFIVLFDKL